MPVMEHASTRHIEAEPLPSPDTIGVSAEHLAEMIRSGHNDDLNELIRNALQVRPAA